ncbi:hypothetical protein BC937DRAFT_93807 [Endogone sp. FLAS-F59071]|nr:hypothetical protein BC937DRAFT_93807 [Endogone sp. FLAS-F59071]|eukprot:RUS21023.1 hypothetical protein BC937DRAFT_93807 [Endogone sp. FLAS-F59071]
MDDPQPLHTLQQPSLHDYFLTSVFEEDITPVTLRALMSSHEIGCLIGKDNATHSALEKRHRVKINFDSYNQRNIHHLVSVAGHVPHVARAWSEILWKLFSEIESGHEERPGVTVLIADSLAKVLDAPFDQVEEGEASSPEEKDERGEDRKDHDDEFYKCKCELDEMEYDSGAMLLLNEQVLSQSTERTLRVSIKNLDKEELQRFETAIQIIGECFFRYRHLAMAPENKYYLPVVKEHPQQQKTDDRSLSGSSSSLPSLATDDELDSEVRVSGRLLVSPSLSAPAHTHTAVTTQSDGSNLWQEFSKKASQEHPAPHYNDIPNPRQRNLCLKLLLSDEEVRTLLWRPLQGHSHASDIEHKTSSTISVTPPPYRKAFRSLQVCEVTHRPQGPDLSTKFACPRIARIHSRNMTSLVKACVHIAFAILDAIPNPHRERPHDNGPSLCLHLVLPNEIFSPWFGYRGNKVEALKARTATWITSGSVLLPGSTERVLRISGSAMGVEEVLRDIMQERIVMWENEEAGYPIREIREPQGYAMEEVADHNGSLEWAKVGFCETVFWSGEAGFPVQNDEVLAHSQKIIIVIEKPKDNYCH